MVDVRDEFIRWSQSYSVKPAEIFAVETDILLNITRQLDIPVTETQQEELAHSPTRNVTAYDSYLLGRRRLSRRNPEGFIAAMESFEQAIASDPGYARAYAGLAEVYLYLGYGFGRYPGHEAGQKALENARKAIQLEPDLAHGYAILAATHFLYQIDGHDLEALFSKALELDPDCTTARHFYSAWLLIRRRDSDKAIEQARIALKTDPLSLQLNNWLGMMFYFAGRYEEALQHAQQWLSIVPQPAGSEHEIGLAHKLMGRSHEMLEREPEAISDYLQEMECFDVPEPVRQGLKQVYETQGWEPFWRAQAIGMEKLWANGNQPWLVAYEIAIGWARLKEVEKVIEWLDMLRKAGCSMMVWLPVEPFLDPLRNDPLLKQWLSEG
jgi:tetratricopeptide (TPR) repeat protein